MGHGAVVGLLWEIMRYPGIPWHFHSNSVAPRDFHGTDFIKEVPQKELMKLVYKCHASSHGNSNKPF